MHALLIPQPRCDNTKTANWEEVKAERPANNLPQCSSLELDEVESQGRYHCWQVTVQTVESSPLPDSRVVHELEEVGEIAIV